MNVEKIYVAGHRGMVGSAIVRQLLAQGVASHRDSLAECLAAFSRQWHAESDALRQIAMAQYQSKKLSRLQVILAAKFGRLGVQLAKDGNLSYQEAWQQSGQGKGAGP